MKLRKRFFSLMLVIVIVLSFSQSIINAADTTTQDTKVISYEEGSFSAQVVQSDESLGQTFTASGKFNTIGFARNDQVTGSYMFELHKDGMDGKILYQHRYPGDNITGPINVIVGDLEAGKYYFALKSVDEGETTGIWMCPDLYPDGSAYFNEEEIPNDLSFNVWYKAANKVAVGNEYDASKPDPAKTSSPTATTSQTAAKTSTSTNTSAKTSIPTLKSSPNPTSINEYTNSMNIPLVIGIGAIVVLVGGVVSYIFLKRKK